MTETVSGPAARKGKRGAKGLKIRRINTTAGVHPYDQVTWERRDVVMTNWRDGSVNFEQHGVEFPDFWSVNAGNIVTTKYFRGAVGTPQREWSLKQLVDRVTNVYTKTGREQRLLRHRRGRGDLRPRAQVRADPPDLQLQLPGLVQRRHDRAAAGQRLLHPGRRRHDRVDSRLVQEEGLIFRGGSGAGVNLSRIRSSKELLSSGGTASGPVSFMRGADASAGTIKSGGATRRAAKMVVLDVDHPDIVDFIETKAKEENKIRALRDAGFDMDLGGADIISVQYQNANNSVRVSDEFMNAVEDGKEFGLNARLTGETIETVDAKGLFRKIAEAAWECADPGLQYDDTINNWHTNPETGRITASNPCSEYLSLDNSSCNLASLNLLKFLKADDTFDAARFAQDVRADHHRDGHLDHLRRVPDGEDPRHHQGLPPARHRLRQPRRAADGDRPRLRLRRRPRHRRRDHQPDDRERLQDVGRAGRGRRPVRRLRRRTPPPHKRVMRMHADASAERPPGGRVRQGHPRPGQQDLAASA